MNENILKNERIYEEKCKRVKPGRVNACPVCGEHDCEEHLEQRIDHSCEEVPMRARRFWA